MPRIAFVIPTLDQSGAERQMALLACGLAHSECDVHVIALNRGGPYADMLQSAGIPLHILSKRFRLDPLALLSLRRILHTLQPQIVQSFLFSANTSVRLPGIAPARSKIVVSERCVDSWKAPWQLRLDRWLSSRTAALTANSASVADFYRGTGFPSDRITVVPNAFVRQHPLLPREDARQQLDLAPHHRVVGFLGRLAPQKRLRDLIWAFQLLHQIVDHARLVLIGDGTQRQELERLAERFGCRSLVHFAGHRSDAAQLLSAFDAFALPSEFEGMSNSLMEAMSAGLPCVASDIPANRELITAGETGRLFPLGNCPELTRQLARILSDPESAQTLGTQAARQIHDNHTLQALIQQHLALYQQLLR